MNLVHAEPGYPVSGSDASPRGSAESLAVIVNPRIIAEPEVIRDHVTAHREHGRSLAAVSNSVVDIKGETSQQLTPA